MPRWRQELMWVKRDDNDVIVQVNEKPPQTDDIIPIVPNSAEYPYKKKAAGQGD